MNRALISCLIPVVRKYFLRPCFFDLGIDPLARKILILTSTNHFYGEFSKIAAEILYTRVASSYLSNPQITRYQNLARPLWPMIENPFTKGG